MSFIAIRGRAGELSLLRRKDLYIDIGGVGEVSGRERIGDREERKGIRGEEEEEGRLGKVGGGV